MKRKARRTPERMRLELLKRGVTPSQTTINRLRARLSRRDARIENLLKKINELEILSDKGIRELKTLSNREIRKRETIIRNLKKKEEQRKERTKVRRKVVYKNRWREFQPSSSVLHLQDNIEKASKLDKRSSDIFEVLQKITYFIQRYNNQNGTSLTIESVISLISAEMVDDLRGIIATQLIVYLNSPHKVRKTLNNLVDCGLMSKKGSSIYYNITFTGREFIKDLTDHLSWGKSEIVKFLKQDKEDGSI